MHNFPLDKGNPRMCLKLDFSAKDITISHLFFADDVTIFSKASAMVARNILAVLKKNSNMNMGSALTVERVLYSSQIVRGMSNKQLQMFLNFRFSSFYFDILGCLFSPLNSKMKLEDCINPLIEKLRKSLVGWKSKILSFAGRLQLIKSTLSSFHLYWASSFLLPKWCLALLERLCCDFFWGCFDSTKKMKTIAWDTICSPLQSGGLGLRSIHASAAAMQLKQAWSLAAQKDSI